MMTQKNISLKSGAFLCLMAICFMSCIKDRPWNFRDGTPGEGGEANITVDTSLKFVDVSKYAQARVFPGLVCSEEPRLQNQHVLMDLNYNYVDEDLRINVPPRPQFSTGLYAAPGELVIIDVPMGDYALSVQVGAWTDNLSNVENAPRDPVIYSRTQLAPGRNYIRNLYGGHIYIFAGRPIPEPVDIVFTNVVKSPDFVLGETSNAAWMEAIRNSCVPYIELRSENVIFVVPRQYCITRNISNPTELMQEWDDALNLDYYQWEGLEMNPADPIDKSPLIPWRVVQDIKPSVGYGHSGFPVVTFNNYGWFDEFTDINQIRGGGCWGTFHEIGHNNQQPRYWSWSTLGETTNNLFVFKVAHRHETMGYDSWPPTHPALPEQFPLALEFAAEDNPTKNFDGSDARIDNPFSRLTPFVQIFDKIPADWGYPGQPDGWHFMTELYQKARRAERISTNDLAKHDFVYEALCDFTHKDWKLFFQQWGIQLSNISMDKMEAKYPPMLQEIWKYNPLTRTGGDTFFNLYARSSWSVSASSEETVGEGGAPQGRAISVLDGDVNTFWHSQWYGAQPDPPHWIEIDMGKSLPVAGFKFTQRQNNQNLKNLKVEVSDDGATWTTVPGSPFLMIQQTATQSFVLPAPITFRYFKVTIETTDDLYGSKYAMMAEADVIKP